jgi:diadenosine tetraphosphate (Ap4A) HIT family hydrolase
VNESCEICRRMARMSADNPYLIAELESGYAVLADNQHIPGYTIFVSKTCAPELHELEPAVRSRFLEEMALVAEATFRAFQPRKLNYELLGNSVSHLHWHLFPRYADDPNPAWPIWNNDAWMNAPKRTPIAAADLASLRDRVRAALDALRVS